MERTARVLAAILGLALAGCASVSGFPDRPENVDSTLASLQSRFFLPGTDVLEVYGNTAADQQKGYRNRVVSGQIHAIDLRFSEFQESLYKEGTLSNLTLDLLGIGVGAAGATVGGATASQILSAVSAGVSGSRTSINKNLYYERTLPAILALMEAERAQVRAEIDKSLLLDTAAYPMEKALGDVGRYFNAGTLPGAIAKLTQEAGKTKQEADDEAKVVRDLQFVNAAAQARARSALELVDRLPEGKAYEVLAAPPSPLDDYTAATVRSRLGDNDLDSDGARALLTTAAGADAAATAQADANSKALLKMILVLMQDRSEENIDKWKAAMTALIPAS